jgi:hypothetical protein
MYIYQLLAFVVLSWCLSYETGRNFSFSGENQKDIEFNIYLSTSHFRRGDTISITGRFKNTGGESVFISRTQNGSSRLFFDILFLNEKWFVPLNHPNTHSADSGVLDIKNEEFVELGPGDTFEYLNQLDTSKYDLSRSKECKLVIYYLSNWLKADSQAPKNLWSYEQGALRPTFIVNGKPQGASSIKILID